MLLPVGKIYKSRFSFMKKTFIFEHDDHAVILEKEKGLVTCYATNSACSEIYCVLPLPNHPIKSKQFVAICYSQEIMLVDCLGLLILIDFGAKKVAVNQPEFQAVGKKDWAEDVQIPWQNKYNVLFGLEGDLGMDEGAARNFWSWFEENEDEIAEKTAQGGELADQIRSQISKRLSRVFPYEKETDIEFQLGTSEGMNALFLYHLNKPQLAEDVKELGYLMPVDLRENWKYITEA